MDNQEALDWAKAEGIPVVRNSTPHLAFHTGEMTGYSGRRKYQVPESNYLLTSEPIDQEIEIRKGGHGIFGNRQDAIDAYDLFKKAENVAGFDIETLGNGGVTEIGVATRSPEGKGANHIFVRPDNIEELQGLVDKVKSDPKSVWKMSGQEQRTLADLTRYSSLDEGFELSKGVHNEVAQELFKGEQLIIDQIATGKYTPHMESGLQTVQTFTEPKEALRQFNDLIKPTTVFAGHNSRSFDVPVLEDWAKRNGGALKPFAAHLDFYDLLQTVDPNLTEERAAVLAEQGKTKLGDMKLQNLIQLFGLESDAHNALGDAGEQGLLGVIDAMDEPIRNSLNESRDFVGQELERQQFERSKLVLSKQTMKPGDVFYAPDWIGNHGGAYEIDTEKGLIQADKGINARSFLKFETFENVTDKEGATQVAAHFYDEVNEQRFLMIGKDIPQLEEHMSQLMPVSKFTPELQQSIESSRLDDLARRRYEDLFSMRQRGTSERATRGAFAAKRMYENALRYDELASQGMNESEIMRHLDFNSQWDPERKTYTHNVAESRDFLRMRLRLSEEAEVMLKVINDIQAVHGEKYLQYMEEGNNQMMRQIRQQVEESFAKVAPTIVSQATESITPVVGRERMAFFNPVKGEMDSLNASSPRKMANDLIKKTRMSKGEKARAARDSGLKGQELDLYLAEKEKGIMQQRLSKMSRVFVSMKDDIGGKQREAIRFAFELSEDPFTLARHMGKSLHQGYEPQTLEVRSIAATGSKPTYDAVAVKQAIEQTQQAYEGTSFHSKEVSGSKLKLGGEIGEVFDELDKPQPKPMGATFEWNGRHKESTERIISAFNEAGMLSTTTYDAQTKNVVVYGYDQSQADSVRTAITRNDVPLNAARVEIPVVRDGQFTYGRQALNARPKVDWNNGVVVHTPASMVADEVEARMPSIVRDLKNNDTENATKTARRAALDGIERFAGAQGMLEVNDTLNVLNTPADRLKQHAIDVDELVTKRLIEDGTLSQEDFIRPIQDEAGKIQNTTAKFLKTESITKFHENVPRILKESGIDAFYGGVKSDHAMKLILGLDDARELIPGGNFLNPARDNPIQNFNGFLMTEDAVRNVERQVTDAGGYFSTDPLLRTPKGEAFFGEYDQAGKRANFNIEAIPMGHVELRKRWEEMAENPEYRQRMIDEGYLIEPTDMHRAEAPRFGGYVLDPVKTPTTYENQGVLAHDVEASRLNYKRVLSGDFIMDKGLEHGVDIKPGQVIGQMRDDSGLYQKVRWDQKMTGRVYVSDGEVGVSYKERAFKYLADTEKFTEQRHPRWVIEGLTGSSTASLIFDPAIKKHQDFGIWMNGRSRMVVPALQEGFEQADDATKIRLQGKLSEAGLQYDSEKKRLLDLRGSMDSFDPEKLNSLLDDEFFGSQRGFMTSKGDERMIVEVIGSNVVEPSKMVQDGKKVLGFNEKGNPIFGQRDGISVGWRELNTLGEQGMTETRGSIMDQMIEAGRVAEKGPVSVATNDRIRNTYTTLQATTEGVEAPVKTIHDFKSLPDADYSMSAYKGTIFDAEGKGVYLQLPEVVGQDGKPINYTYVAGTGKEASRQSLNNRVFIPKTGLTGADGKYYMDDLNQHIAAIFRKAEQVSKSTSYEKQIKAQSELQGTIDNYFGAVKRDLSSSKGFVGEHGVKARIDGLSGLYKMADPSMSRDLVGDFEFLTETQAKSLGILDKLQAGEEVYGMTTRYPSFHKDSMVPVQYRLGGTDERFIVGSAYAGEKHRADMDGDAKHTAVISTEENVQEEMRKAWSERAEKEEARYQSFLKKQLSDNPQFSWKNLLGDVPEFQAMGANTSEEIASKVGRGIVGMLSDFNLELRQLGGEAFGLEDGRYEAMARLGELSEQKLISSKHGLNLVDGKLPAMAFMDYVRSGTIEGHQKAMELADVMFGADVAKEANIASALDASREAMGRTERTMKDPGFNFGKSRGVGNSMDLNTMKQYIQENPGVNSFREQLQNILDGDALAAQQASGSTTSQVPPEPPPTGPSSGGTKRPDMSPPPESPPSGGGGGGGPTPPKDGKSGFWKGASKGKKALLVGGGVALLGVAGYNMVRDDSPLPTQGGVGSAKARPAPHAPSVSQAGPPESSRGYDVQVNTKGAVSAGRVENAMHQYQGGSLTVSRQDNTKQLNSLFYRDQVESHI